jgi:hypothetical protein
MPKTSAQVLNQQEKDAEQARAARVPVARTAAVPAVPDTRTPQERYLDTIAPAAFPGRLVKFSKDGEFVIAESSEKVPSDKSLVALCGEVLVGWIKFGEEGEPPARAQGLHYGGFIMPPRESLGDLDQSEWPLGLNGQPSDPWQHQICLPLQDRESSEMYTFATTSVSGRRAVGNLLRHYERLRKSHPDTYPIVQLRPSGFNHRDPRVGWVATPTFAVVGRIAKDSAELPAMAAELEDEIPF